MANGTKHLNANIVGGLGIYTLLNISNNTIYIDSSYLYIDSSMLGIGLILGTIITPDYDFNKIYVKKLIKKIPVLGFFWNLYWYPYSLLFKHRGISHNLILGTITRVIYLCLPIILLYILGYIHIQIDYIYVYIIIGWYLQDFIHYILDSKLLKNFI